MYFTEFRLTNFGLYPGENILDLRSPAVDGATERPVILIGGKNGAGKTTILEAVRLCLYGASALGKGVKRTVYEDYLQRRIHRPLGVPFHHSFAGVSVSFTHTVGSTTHEFFIQRMWERWRSGIRETVKVTRDGVLLNQQEMEWWDQFLHDLLPSGLADLFFFDGEKIQSLADDADYTLLGSSIRSLLGLDLLDRLHNDLHVYLARQRRKGGQGLDDLLSDLQLRRGQIEEAFGKAHAELAHTNSLIAHKQGKVEETERLLASEGGGIAAQRERLMRRAESLQEIIRRHERSVAEHANNLLPFAIVPQIALQLKARLELDERVEHYIEVSTVADYFVEEFNYRLLAEDDWLNGVKLTNKQREKLMEGIKQKADLIRNNLVQEESVLADETVIHPLEKEERRELVRWLDQAVSVVPSQLIEIGAALEEAISELAEVEATLSNLPAEENIQPILQQLSALQREMGILESQKTSQENIIEQLRQKREALERDEKELYTRLMRGDDPDHRARLASRSQQVLVRYERELRRIKIAELEKAIVESFGQLSRKGRYIHKVAIDTETFATTLYNRKGDGIPREQLSAGEKQIYAVALLWALRVVSGRTLPIIIDTPLGRLDSEHRRRLVQHYFPQASHQVVLLSTDTEIDGVLYKALEPSVARSFRLDYKPEEATTKISDGYFWDNTQEVADAVKETISS